MTTNWEKLEKGLDKYVYLMDNLHKVNVSLDLEYQKKFKGFYRIRRNDAFCKIYFSILEKNKTNRNLTFEYVLKKLLPLGRLEASFSSKLVATINSDLPVWDSVVLGKMTGELPEPDNTIDRIQASVHKYNFLITWSKRKLASDEGKRMLQVFNERYPKVKISDAKKIDLILWQTREGNFKKSFN
jgi:hypothetical protein